MSTKQNERQRQHEFMLDKIREYNSQSLTQREISTKLQISLGSVNKGLQELRAQAKENIKYYIEDTLVQEFSKIDTGLQLIIKNSWQRYEQALTDKERYAFLSLARDTYQLRATLLDSGTVIEKAVTFVNNTRNIARGLTQQNTKVALDESTVQAQSSMDIHAKQQAQSSRVFSAKPVQSCEINPVKQAQSGATIPAGQEAESRSHGKSRNTSVTDGHKSAADIGTKGAQSGMHLHANKQA